MSNLVHIKDMGLRDYGTARQPPEVSKSRSPVVKSNFEQSPNNNDMNDEYTQEENFKSPKEEQVEEKRMKWLHKAAKAGNKRAQYQLGLCYYYGRFGIEKDQSLATAWFKEAAKAGLRRAQKMLMEILPHNDPDLYYLHKEHGDPAEAERLLEIHERMI